MWFLAAALLLLLIQRSRTLFLQKHDAADMTWKSSFGLNRSNNPALTFFKCASENKKIRSPDKVNATMGRLNAT